MTMTARSASGPSEFDRRLTAIQHTYPAWNIRRRPNNMWIATRTTPPTPAQTAAGLHHHIVQPGLDALTAVLSEQLLIALTIV